MDADSEDASEGEAVATRRRLDGADRPGCLFLFLFLFLSSSTRLKNILPLPRFWATASSIGAHQISFHPTTSSNSTRLDCCGLEIHPPDPDLDRFLLLVNLLGSFLQLILVDVIKPGATVELRDAKIDMFKGLMRLALDKWGTVKATESPSEFTVKEDNNLSLIEFELVTVME